MKPLNDMDALAFEEKMTANYKKIFDETKAIIRDVASLIKQRKAEQSTDKASVVQGKVTENK